MKYRSGNDLSPTEEDSFHSNCRKMVPVRWFPTRTDRGFFNLRLKAATALSSLRDHEGTRESFPLVGKQLSAADAAS